jgi:hypothetical protein
MHFTLFSIFPLLVLTTFVHSAPTAPLDAATLLNNAQQAQQLNAQFRSANGTTTGTCNNGDTTCVQGAIASCINGQFDTSKGRCPATEQCFALPSVNSNGTTIACTSEKSARSLINAAGATGDVTGSVSGNPTNSINPASTLSGATPGFTASETAASNLDYYSMTTATTFAPTPAATAASNQPATTVTVTLIVTALPSPSMITTTLPTVTRTLSPEQASSLLASLLAQGAQTAPTTDSSSETVSSTVSATATVIPTATPNLDSYPGGEPSASLSSTVSASTTNIPLPASPSTITPVAIVNNTNSLPNPGSGGYNGY